MIVLKNDLKELFATATVGTTTPENSRKARRYCSFLTQAPIIMCDFTGEELAADDLLAMLLTHEICHYEDIFAILPILLHHWLTLFSFIDFQKFLIRKRAESRDLVIRFEEIPSLYNPEHPPFLKGIFRNIPNKGMANYDLTIPLEGLALYRSIAASSHSTGIRFMKEAFGSLEMRERVNAMHWFAFLAFNEIFEELKKVVDKKNMLRSMLAVINFGTRLPPVKFAHMKDLFKVSLSLDQDYNDYSAKVASLQNMAMDSLRAFEFFREQPRDVVKSLLFDKDCYQLLLKLLFKPATKEMKAINYSYPSFITYTAGQLGTTLYAYFAYTIRKYLNKGGAYSTIAEEYLCRQGTIAPVCYCKNGVLYYRPNENAYPYIAGAEEKGVVRFIHKSDLLVEEFSAFEGTVELWLNFLTIKTVIRWLRTLNYWVCPLYKFFSHKIGEEEGKKFQRNFCGLACSPLQSRRNTDVLDVKGLDKGFKGTESCPFWSRVKEIFSGFRTIRIERPKKKGEIIDQ